MSKMGFASFSISTPCKETVGQDLIVFAFVNNQPPQELMNFFLSVWMNVPENFPGHMNPIGDIRRPVADKLRSYIPQLPGEFVIDNPTEEATAMAKLFRIVSPATSPTDFGGFTVIVGQRVVVFRYNEKLGSQEQIVDELQSIIVMETLMRGIMNDETADLFPVPRSSADRMRYTKQFHIQVNGGLIINFRNHDIPNEIKIAYRRKVAEIKSDAGAKLKGNRPAEKEL